MHDLNLILPNSDGFQEALPCAFLLCRKGDAEAVVGLTRGALYQNFGDDRGLFAAGAAEIDSAMAKRAIEAENAV
jgi:hypothetical protein